MRRLVICVLLAACATEAESELAPSGPVEQGKGDGFCPGVPARIAPTTLPDYSCGPLNLVNGTIMADVNRFWGSNVVGCACGPDFPEGCIGAWSRMTTGYVWIGEDFLSTFNSSGSYMPTEYAISHEFGHEIEGHYNALAPTTQQRELTADCLSGYYLGSHICRGTATQHDLIATLATACLIADGTGNPITDLNTHGTCQQRMEALGAGMQAYLNGALPLVACRL